MGTQQILLIVLSVIVVGVAITVGFGMFASESENANRLACQQDAKLFYTKVLEYYKMPSAEGGGYGDSANWTVANIIGYINRGTVSGSKITTENGVFTFTLSGKTVNIEVDPKEANVATFNYTMNLSTDKVPSLVTSSD